MIKREKREKMKLLGESESGASTSERDGQDKIFDVSLSVTLALRGYRRPHPSYSSRRSMRHDETISALVSSRVYSYGTAFVWKLREPN